MKSLSSDKKGSNEVNLKESNIVSNHSVKRINPVYPDRAKLLKIGEKVTIVYNIKTTGRVKNIRIVHSSSSGIFDRSVRLAMSR